MPTRHQFYLGAFKLSGRLPFQLDPTSIHLMFPLADVSLHDERPPKRRKIESASSGGQLHHGIVVGLQQQQLHALSCCICNQPMTIVRSFSCPSCQQICCERCTGQCDADALSLNDFRAATPPLDYDEEDGLVSSPSSPTPTRERIATPDPFDANVLRARLSLAARALSANSLLLQKKRKRKDPVGSGSNGSFNANGTASHGTGRQLSMSMSAAAFSGTYDMNVVEMQMAPNAQGASRHRQPHLSHHRTQYNQQAPPATFRYASLRAPTIDGGAAGYQGCCAKLCSKCLVRTADGHKICIDCLEESLTS